MKKSSILLIILFIIFSCKNDTTITESVSENTQITNQQGDYKKVLFTTKNNYKEDSNQLSTLNLNFDNYNLEFNLLEENTFITTQYQNKLVKELETVDYNFTYDSDFETAEKEISIYHSESFNEGILILPIATEEYEKFSVYNFSKDYFNYLGNLTIENTSEFEKFNKTNNIPFQSQDFTIVNNQGIYSFTKKLSSNVMLTYKLEKETINPNKSLIDKIKSLKSSNNPNKKDLSQFNLIDSKMNDFDNNGINDKIEIFDNKRDFTSDDETTKKCPIIVSMNESKTLFENPNIFRNDSFDKFKKIDCKDGYFTVILFNEVPDSSIYEKYLTFKFDNTTKKFFLTKYTFLDLETNKRIDKTEKNFGKIDFESLDLDNLK
ncbi:hypothetical protein BWK59_12790 [Flavobacterium davisii]|uniref:Lipoprotein n=1 Tax=Flavobacterium davisii TaxID=2906077 RepID=A0A246GFT3_9FLAO|nr:hypothetical protein [Flavobacterium davisii]OWP83011.1 hypothetical protein BWK59_12790 [Flavobacterium davisii]